MRWSPEVDREWQELTAGLLTGFRAWREGQPAADLTAIEAALDERWWAVRARLIEDAVQTSALADLRGSPARPPCPACGAPTHADGRATRQLTTQGDRPLRVTRSRARCPACGAGFFPPR
jgi:hypothetical protein